MSASREKWGPATGYATPEAAKEALLEQASTIRTLAEALLATAPDSWEGRPCWCPPERQRPGAMHTDACTRNVRLLRRAEELAGSRPSERKEASDRSAVLPVLDRLAQARCESVSMCDATCDDLGWHGAEACPPCHARSVLSALGVRS